MMEVNGRVSNYSVSSVKPTTTAQMCSRCQKLLVMCTCGPSITSSGGNLWDLDVVFTTGFDSDDLLPGLN